VCRRFKYSTYLAATARVSGRVVQLATQIFVSCSMTGSPVPRGECASAVRCDADGEQKIKPSTVRPWPLRRDPNSRRLAGPCGGDTEPAGAAAEHPGRVAFVLRRRRGSELDPSRARQPRGYGSPARRTG